VAASVAMVVSSQPMPNSAELPVVGWVGVGCIGWGVGGFLFWLGVGVFVVVVLFVVVLFVVVLFVWVVVLFSGVVVGVGFWGLLVEVFFVLFSVFGVSWGLFLVWLFVLLVLFVS